uniref:NACHT domain-containing protein n=1 Tax=Macrostomum lignano TaxID=282301 RepID=A0A1I8HIM4_9PLAT
MWEGPNGSAQLTAATRGQCVYLKVMKGRLDDLPIMNSRVVRIFLSSTFSDMGTERNYLMQHVNPRLKKFCRDSFGLEFQTIDMRWGVGDEVQLDHQGPYMCYQEIDNSLIMSAGPYFICLLGQRYGNQPPAALVEVDVFNNIVEALKEDGRDVSCLHEWYTIDENNKPPICVLRPIATLAEAADKELLKAARQRWEAVQDSIIGLMKRGAELCLQKTLISHATMKKFTASVTEMEVISGILSKPPQKLAQALAFVREFSDLESQRDFSRGKMFKFIDLTDSVNEDGEAVKVLDEAVNAMVKELNRHVLTRMAGSNSFTYSLKWTNDAEGVGMSSHKDYLEKFGSDYCDNVKRLVAESVRESMRLRSDDLYSEVLQHSTACVNYVKKFQGRQEIIDKVKAYVQASNTTEPLVVYGDSGSGKTSLLGKAASLVRSWLPESDSKDAIVLLRFLGTSPGTSSIRQTLKYLCRQLAVFGNEDDQEKCESLDDFKEILNTFYSMLERMGQFRRILVFLDSVDQLDSSDGAYHLTWVRTPLPANVKMVVSTLPNMFDLLKTFKGKLPNPDIYVEVTPLETSLCTSILSALLSEQGRTLNEQQWALVEQAFSKCSLPIYVHLLYHEVLRWRSYQQVDESSLRYTVRQAIFQLFEKLELKHGRLFTSHALAFITASRNGLSESELEDLLSLDDAVLIDVFQHHLPPFIRIPPICWARLRHDIGSYLVEREADNIRVVFWYHRQFIEVAQEYFLSDEKTRRDIHSIMADYFLGLWSGRRKKFVYPAYLRKKLNLPEFSMEDRAVPEQPFVLRKDEDGTAQYNLRKLNELPWHLIKSGRVNEFYDYIVFDYDFMFNKLKGTSRYLLLRDLDLPQKLGVEYIKEAELVYNAIRLSAQSLVYDPVNLSVDLIGRLIMYEKDCPRVKLLLNQCRQSKQALSNCCLIPKVQCFDSGSGVLYSSFDLGLGMGLVMPNGQLVSFSLINNEVTWYDIEGNEIKRFSSDYNLFLSMKYMSTGYIPDDCVMHVLSMRSKNAGVTEDDRQALVLNMGRKKIQEEIEEYEACNKDVPQELRDMMESLNAGEIPDSIMEKLDVDGMMKKMMSGEEEAQKSQDLVRVDFMNGRVTKLMTLDPSWSVSSDDVEYVTKDYVLCCKGKSDSTGTSTLRLLSLGEKKFVALYEENTSGTSRIGTQNLDSKNNLLCFGIEAGSNHSTLLVFMNLNTKEIVRGSLPDIFKSADKAELESMWRYSPLKQPDNKKEEKTPDENCEKTEADESPAASEADLKSKAIELLQQAEEVSASSCLIDHEGNIVAIESFDIKYSQNFVSPSRRRMTFLLKRKSRLYGQTSVLRGLLYDCDEKRAVGMTISPEQDKFKKAASSFGDGTQAKFTEDERLLVTSGSKPKGTDFFTICHFPDESAGDSDERMFIMTKVYNLKHFTDKLSHHSEEDALLPMYTQVKPCKNATGLTDCHTVDIRTNEALISLNTRTLVVKKSSSRDSKEDDQVETLRLSDKPPIIELRRDPKAPFSVGISVISNQLVEKVFGSTSKEELLQSRKSKSVGGVEFKFHVDAENESTKEKKDKKEETKEPSENQETKEENSTETKGDEEELTEAAKKAKEEKFLKKRLNNRNDLVDIQFLPEKCTLNLAFSQHLKASEEIRVGVGVPPIWLGAVVRLDYSDVEKGTPTSEMQFQHSIGKVFDMGPAVAFLHDNQHLVNYKLQIVDYMKGEVIRCLSQDEDLYFVRLQATPDCSLLVGQVYFPAYEVEFAVFDDESMNNSDMFAIVPPRGLQVYVISDGRRVANYLFESDPFGLCLVGEDGRDLLVLTHNAPIMLFELHDPQPLVAADGAAQMHSMKAIDATANADSSVGSPAKAPGPRPEYLDMLTSTGQLNGRGSEREARGPDRVPGAVLLRYKAQCDSQQPDI